VGLIFCPRDDAGDDPDVEADRGNECEDDAKHSSSAPSEGVRGDNDQENEDADDEEDPEEGGNEGGDQS
jgi:hypothetical protein